MCGGVRAVDVMIEFSVAFILSMELGTWGKRVDKWMREYKEMEGYKRVEHGL